MLVRYEASGRIGRFIALTWLAALGASVGGAWGYQAALGATTSVKLHLVFVLVYVGVLGGVGVLAAYLAPCRSLLASFLLGVTVGLVGLGAGHFFVYQWALDGGQTQLSFVDFLKHRAEMGFKVGRGAANRTHGDFSGWAAWTVWGIEAVLLVGAPICGAMYQATRPFCEGCGWWASTEKEEFTLNAPDESLTKAIKRATSLVEVLPPEGSEEVGAGPSDTMLKYKITGCPKCQETDWLTVTHRTIKTKGSKTENVDSDLQSGLLVGPEEVDIIRTILDGPQGQPADAQV